MTHLLYFILLFTRLSPVICEQHVCRHLLVYLHNQQGTRRSPGNDTSYLVYRRERSYF
jgi:hypothetical protein